MPLKPIIAREEFDELKRAVQAISLDSTEDVKDLEARFKNVERALAAVIDDVEAVLNFLGSLYGSDPEDDFEAERQDWLHNHVGEPLPTELMTPDEQAARQLATGERVYPVDVEPDVEPEEYDESVEEEAARLRAEAANDTHTQDDLDDWDNQPDFNRWEGEGGRPVD